MSDLQFKMCHYCEQNEEIKTSESHIPHTSLYKYKGYGTNINKYVGNGRKFFVFPSCLVYIISYGKQSCKNSLHKYNQFSQEQDIK